MYEYVKLADLYASLTKNLKFTVMAIIRVPRAHSHLEWARILLCMNLDGVVINSAFVNKYTSIGSTYVQISGFSVIKTMSHV